MELPPQPTPREAERDGGGSGHRDVAALRARRRGGDAVGADGARPDALPLAARLLLDK